jgi:hypothetical protein
MLELLRKMMKRMTTMTKSYLELCNIKTFEERFAYLQLNGVVGDLTFNGHRYANQKFYNSPEWKRVRRRVIIRDNGCDLGLEGYEIHGSILIHHINPITIDDLINMNPDVFDLNNLICVTHATHNAIHYGDAELIQTGPVTRTKNDTCLWR